MNEPPPIPPMLPQFEGAATWNGSVVSVRARVVPRFLWTTASIDVYLDDQCVLQTGGKLNPAGSFSATFDRGGVTHIAELSWGVAVWYSFPYQLKIDGVPVMNSRVRADNWYLSLVVGIFLGTILGASFILLRHRFLQGIPR